MKFTLPKDTFPAVVLSKEKQAAFIDEAETVVREAIAANEEFLAGGAIFRDPKWKLVRAKEGLSVYRQRRSAPGISRDSTKISKPSSPPSQSSSLSFKRRGRAASDMHWAMSTEEESSFSESTGSCIQDKMKRPEVSLMVMHGIMDGSLADCMYGTFAPTNRSWMWRCSHLNERFDDSRILANIMGPTRKDPFRSLGIKWFVKETPAVLTGIVQQRDYLVLEGTGLTRDSRGDTVGYYLLHSVSLSEIPALSDLSIIRGQMSFCFVDRQCACNVHNCFGLPSEERSAMKFTLPENAFPDVNLSKEHQNALIDEAEKLVRETLEANEAFLADGAKFRDPRWRMVCAKDGLNVYHRQRPRPKSQRSLRLPRKKAFSPVLLSESHATNTWGGGEVTTDDEASVSSSSTQEAVKRPAGFEMILHGTVDGILDDAMYGTFAATDQAWMWRSSHINDRLDDARVLATIRGPTREDPFRFLGVKWFVKERPVVLTSLVQQRDYLILEATGLTRDSKGEKVGYYLMHSISLPRIFPELTELGLLRGDLSLCFIDRQLGHNKVEKYCRNFSNPRGKIPDRVAVAVTADALICAANVIDYAYIKKLTWLMKEKGEEIAARHCRPSGESRPKCCQNCSKGFSKFALPGSRSGVDCQICRRVVCGRCNVTKKMTVDVSETGSVKQCALRFCLECIREAKEKSVWEMAISGIETSSETSSASGSGLSGRHR
ncbi:tRNA (guanine(26)-N(2))-dimethyltransferase [Phytophthora cinnamomi]|uniref:tRNA (guanine(26)-N(2))-dimethyltransferase n=1 Tax=Phytophthora cinnamomi TaxID=4785 RepID=UPI00355A4D30|nr:tRNA (guanine(26)-N(2))-dimethyltransferase [Phytophthora cinnamomi]